MEFKNFEELNNKVNEILENFNLKNDVNIIRKSLDKDLLNSFCRVQTLNKMQKISDCRTLKNYFAFEDSRTPLSPDGSVGRFTVAK